MSKGDDSGGSSFNEPDDPFEDVQFQAPNLAAQAPVFTGYGYDAPMMQMVPAASQLPQMSVDPNAIMDPSVLAALEILNRPMMVAQAPEMLGSGTQYQETYGLLPSIAPTPMPVAPKQEKPSRFSLMNAIRSQNQGFDNPFDSGAY